jgi:predicted nucleotide-binding protein
MQDVKDWFKSQTAMTFRGKLECPPAKLVAELTRLLGGQQRLPRIFIVHGRDTGTLLEVKNFIQNKLQFGEPIILADQPSRGRTIIEKFEAYAHQIDLVFVILTPDDIGQLAKSKVQDSRARQNVIFELGYFMGSLGRKNGRVILLRKGAIEIPSDLHGVVYLDISQGVQSVAEDIRQEINAWLR